MTDDLDFYAWLDGELPEPEASAMAAKVAADPELAAFAEQHRALAGRLKSAFATVIEAPVPDRLREPLQPRTAEVIDLSKARERRRGLSLGAFAVAASLALGLGIGVALPRDGGPFRSEGGELAAAGALDTALDTQLASAGERGGIRMGLSFKDKSGNYCRSFMVEAQSGLACRSGDRWLVEGVVRGEAPQGEYRMAAGQNPALAALIEERMSGDPLDQRAEVRQVKRQWSAD